MITIDTNSYSKQFPAWFSQSRLEAWNHKAKQISMFEFEFYCESVQQCLPLKQLKNSIFIPHVLLCRLDLRPSSIVVQSARAKTCRGRQVRIVLPTGEEFIPHPQEHEEDHQNRPKWQLKGHPWKSWDQHMENYLKELCINCSIAVNSKWEAALSELSELDFKNFRP